MVITRFQEGCICHFTEAEACLVINKYIGRVRNLSKLSFPYTCGGKNTRENAEGLFLRSETITKKQLYTHILRECMCVLSLKHR